MLLRRVPFRFILVCCCCLWCYGLFIVEWVGGRGGEKKQNALSNESLPNSQSIIRYSVAHIVASPARNHSTFFWIINLHRKKDKVRRNYFFILDITCTRHTVHTIHFKLLCTLCILFRFYCSVWVVEIKKSFTLYRNFWPHFVRMPGI